MLGTSYLYPPQWYHSSISAYLSCQWYFRYFFLCIWVLADQSRFTPRNTTVHQYNQGWRWFFEMLFLFLERWVCASDFWTCLWLKRALKEITGLVLSSQYDWHCRVHNACLLSTLTAPTIHDNPRTVALGPLRWPGPFRIPQQCVILDKHNGRLSMVVIARLKNKRCDSDGKTHTMFLPPNTEEVWHQDMGKWCASRKNILPPHNLPGTCKKVASDLG